MSISHYLTRCAVALTLVLLFLSSVHVHAQPSLNGVASTAADENNVKTSAAQTTEGNVYFVSKRGNNHDGRSWATAWNELNQIGWSIIRPGDTILLDGGTTAMRYTTTLIVGASGTRDQPITITRAGESGHNGQVIIFGGRTTPLPYCGQRSYRYHTRDVRTVGIRIDQAAYVVIDGRHWRGITIHGHNGAGIQLSSSASNITLRNLEIYDNGSAYRAGGRWYPTRYGLSEGINLSGTDITVERTIIHDNGSDAIQSGGGVRNFTLRQAWLYNGRTLPNSSTAFNRCTHQDGIQIHNGGTQSGVTIEDSIVGPRLLQGVLLGQPGRATINDVTIQHSLFYDSDNVNISTHHTNPQHWTLEHVTSIRAAGAKNHNIMLRGSGHTITNSVFAGGQRITVPDEVQAAGNCQANVAGDIGTEVERVSTGVQRRAGARMVGDGCTGSRITSPAQLLADVPSDALPTSEAPRPSPTPPPSDPIVELPPFEPPIIDDPILTPVPSPPPSPTAAPDPPSVDDPPIIADPPGLPEPPRLPSPGPWTVELCIRIKGATRVICQEYILVLTEDGHLTVGAEQEQGMAR